MYKRGNRWYADFWYEGQRYVKSLGPISKTVAKEKDRTFRTEVADGRYQKRKNDLPFSKAMDEYLKKSATQNKVSSYKRNELSAKHLKAHFGDRKLSKIEGNEVLIRNYVKKRKDDIKTRQLKRGRTEEQVTYTSINRELALLRAMFNVSIKAGKAKKNPVALVTIFEEIQKERILTEDEEILIIQELEKADKRYNHLKDMIKIALNTGMRQGEILAMKKSWIKLREKLIIIPRYSQKRNIKDKRVPINSAIKPIIKRLLKKNPDSEYLFVNPKTGNRFTTIQNSWNGILKKAGLEGKPGVDKLRFHDLRHTAATNLARGGKDMKFIAQYLGHSDVRTSARYVHYSDDDLKKGAEILARVPSKFTTPKTKASKTQRAHSSVG